MFRNRTDCSLESRNGQENTVATLIGNSSHLQANADFRVASSYRLSPREITVDIEDAWLGFTEHLPFNSPYYHPQFVRAVAAVRDDVEIAILCNSQQDIVGVFPFQRRSSSSIEPIGGRMNDFHGVIGAPGLRLAPEEILKYAGARRFGFHALQWNGDAIEPFRFERLKSYYIDLSEGYSRYAAWLINHSSTIKRLPQKIRAMERDIGPIRFELESYDGACLERLIQLKREKFKRTHTFDILSVDWTVDLLREVFWTKQENFRGALSVLWAGDEMVAAQMGMICGKLLHYWFPAFDSRFQKYSPGLQMLQNSCRAACDVGIDRIDMSYGESSFKDKFCNRSCPVQFGLIDDNKLSLKLLRQRYFWRKKLKAIPFKEALKFALREALPRLREMAFFLILHVAVNHGMLVQDALDAILVGERQITC